MIFFRKNSLFTDRIFYTTFIWLVATVAIPCYLSAQEVCDNGTDDDSDGLVDLNDGDCHCGNVLNLAPNFSFEDTLCCPSGYAEMHCVEAWMQASVGGTSDFLHFCSNIFLEESPLPPLPLVCGEGFTGFLDGGRINSSYKEYVGTCLEQLMIKDTNYILEFYLGFGLKTDKSYSSSSPFEICIYGNSNCTALPFEGRNCPLLSATPGWELLGCQMVEGTYEWIQVFLESVSNKAIEAIAIGPNCDEVLYNGDENYYYLDGLALYKNTTPPIIILQSGLPCLGNVILAIPPYPNSNYQWFLDGVAIEGATQNTYEVPEGGEAEGRYEVMITNSEGCHITSCFPYIINGYPIADLDSTAVLCSTQPLTLGENNEGTHFQWSTGETTPTITPSEPGVYTVTVTNECGEATDEITVLGEGEVSSCTFATPNAFTPDADGINDSFGPLTLCCLKNYDFQVFSRWGKRVFQSNTLQHRWDGTFNGQPLPPDTYVWKVVYEVVLEGQEEIITKSGSVLLIR